MTRFIVAPALAYRKSHKKEQELSMKFTIFLRYVVMVVRDPDNDDNKLYRN